MARQFRAAGPLLLAVVVLGAGILGSAPPADAAGTPPIVRAFSVWAENRASFGSPRLFAFAFVDDPDGQVPSTITSVVLTVPAGTVTLTNNYNYPNLDFFGQYCLCGDPVLTPTPGVYTLTVTDNQGNVVTATKTLGTVPALSPPTVTLPTSEQIISTTTPTFQWNAVAGAAKVEVRIHNLDIFTTFGDSLFTSLLLSGSATSYTVPSGILTPGRRYLVRVNAFDGAGLLPSNIRAATGVPFSVAGPSVAISLNKSVYVAGDQLLLSASYRNNAAAPTFVEAELLIGLPGGAPLIWLAEADLLLSPTLPDVSTPLVTNFLLYTFNGSEPAGHYVVRLLFYDLNGPGEIAEAFASFRIGP